MDQSLHQDLVVYHSASSVGFGLPRSYDVLDSAVVDGPAGNTYINLSPQSSLSQPQLETPHNYHSNSACNSYTLSVTAMNYPIQTQMSDYTSTGQANMSYNAAVGQPGMNYTSSPSHNYTANQNEAVNYTSSMNYPVSQDISAGDGVMLQPKQEPYPDMAENMSFAHLATLGHSQYPAADLTGYMNYQPMGDNYRDTYESGSPESHNSNSPPVVTYQYTGTPDNSPPRTQYLGHSPKNSPPRITYGLSNDTCYKNGSPPSAASNYEYPTTGGAASPFPVAHIKTERASPCPTPNSHHENHPYARPASSSPRLSRRPTSDPAGKLSPSGSPNSTRRAHVLPPCKVCGVQATGFHYGVNTCEACKGFFRRSIIRKEEYVCLKSSKCIIEPGKRNLCGHCRYKKCLEAGMSVEGIKTGRYTYQKRTKDILELQQLKKEQSEVRNLEVKRMKEAQTRDLLAGISDVAKKYPDVFYSADPVTHQRKYLEEKQMLSELFGKMERINTDDYVYALENLGLELDDRREIANQIIEELNSKMPGIFAALQDFPGVKNINYNDQINLLKYSYYDIWFVARFGNMNLEEGCFTTPTGLTFDMANLFGQQAADTTRRVASRVSQYHLVPQEKILLVAIIYLSTDRVYLELEDRDNIDRVRELYIESLEVCLEMNHPDIDQIFAKTLQMIADVRTVTQAVKTGLRALLKYTDSKKYPLVHDILTVH